jgi:hypothetical protein
MLQILLVSMMAYRVQSQEIKWGMEEEARSLVIGVSEMIRLDTVNQLAAGTSPEEPVIQEQLVRPLQTVMKWNEVRRIDLFTPDGKGWLYSTMPEQRDSALPPDDVLEQLKAVSVYVSEIHDDGKDFSSVDAFTVMRSDNGGSGAIVRVEILVDDILALSTGMLKRIVIVAVLALLLAVLVAFITSGIISREINDLNREAVGVVVADDNAVQGGGAIKEISDLSNTLHTMDNVLQEVLMRTKRRFVQNEQFRTNDDLARQFESFSWPEASLSLSGRMIYVCASGKRVPVNFFSLRSVVMVKRCWCAGTVTVPVCLNRVCRHRTLNTRCATAFMPAHPSGNVWPGWRRRTGLTGASLRPGAETLCRQSAITTKVCGMMNNVITFPVFSTVEGRRCSGVSVFCWSFIVRNPLLSVSGRWCSPCMMNSRD